MSTSPIGTRVPTIAPNAIIRAGIPLSDNFNATDVAVTVESLLALVPPSTIVESGTWTPTFSGASGAVASATLTSAKYSRVGTIVTCTIRGVVNVDFSGVDAGEFIFTFPIATASDNAIGAVNLNLANQCNGVVRNNLIVLLSGDTAFIDANAAFYAIFQYEIN